MYYIFLVRRKTLKLSPYLVTCINAKVIYIYIQYFMIFENQVFENHIFSKIHLRTNYTVKVECSVYRIYKVIFLL